MTSCPSRMCDMIVVKHFFHTEFASKKRNAECKPSLSPITCLALFQCGLEVTSAFCRLLTRDLSRCVIRQTIRNWTKNYTEISSSIDKESKEPFGWEKSFHWMINCSSFNEKWKLRNISKLFEPIRKQTDTHRSNRRSIPIFCYSFNAKQNIFKPSFGVNLSSTLVNFSEWTDFNVVCYAPFMIFNISKSSTHKFAMFFAFFRKRTIRYHESCWVFPPLPINSFAPS